MSMNKDTVTSISSKNQPLGTLTPIIIGVLWFLIIVPTYLLHHPYYSRSISQFKYWGLLGGLSILFAGAYFFFVKTNSKWRTLNGWKLYGLLLLTMNSILAWYGISNDFFQSHPLVHLGYFTGLVILLHLAVLFITVIGYAVGEMLLQPFAQQLSQASFSLVAVALGWSVIAFVLLLLGLFKLLYPIALWAPMLVLIILRYQVIGQLLHRTFLRPIAVKSLKTQGFLSLALLLIFAGVNALGAVKAFPSGFDGAGLYMNVSQLIGEYQALPEGGQAFNWSIIMSLGDLLFGSMTVAIFLSNLMGLFCVLVVFRLARLFVSSSNALLVAAIFYTAPVVTYHNYFDEKVDLGFLFVSLCTLLLLLEYLVRSRADKAETGSISPVKIGSFQLSSHLLLWIMIGWLTGFAFGIKYVALFNIIALIGLLFYQKGGRSAFAGSFLLALSLLFLLGIHQFSGLALDGNSSTLLGVLLLIPSLILLGRAFRSSYPQLIQLGTLIGAFVLAMGLNYAPWAIKHGLENRSISISALVEGKSPEPKIKIKPKFRNQQRQSNSKLSRKKREASTKAAQQTRREELQRYQGFEKGLPLFLSLPYDLTMNTNLPNQSYLDIGFLWLLLLPLLLLSIRARNLWKNLIWLAFMLFFLLLAVLSVFVKKASIISTDAYIDRQAEGFQAVFGDLLLVGMNSVIYLSKKITPLYDWLSGFNFWVSAILLLLLLVLASWLASERLKEWPGLLKKLMAFSTIYLFIWLLLGSGVPWYAFLLLATLGIIVVYYFEHPQLLFGTRYARFASGFLSLSFGLYFLLNLSLHFHDANRPDNQHLIFQKPFIQYASQKLKSEDVIALFNPASRDALKYLNQNPSEKIYRVGTFLNYHILQNDRRVVEDNQLGKFSEISAKLSDPNYFISVLRDQGFRYIIYDLNTASIDRTPEQSLTKKNNEFLNRIIDPNTVKLLVTDRIIEDPNNTIELPSGTVNGRYGLNGQVVFRGSFVLFEIL